MNHRFPPDIPERLVQPARLARWRLRWVVGLAGSRGRDRARFTCNVCGRRTSFPREGIGREFPSCGWCGSTVRVRALVQVLATTLSAASATGPELPVHKELVGIGFSDQENYARLLQRSTSYTNSWFHQEPLRDVMDLASFGCETYDFAICSEVLEHVPQPIETALATLAAILKPGGTLFLSVPLRDGTTREHFPALASFDLVPTPAGHRLSGVTVDGNEFESDSLVFHGGPGSTLEMRVVGRDSLRAGLEQAGFGDISEHMDEAPEIGVLWAGTPETIATDGGVAVGLHAGIWTATRLG